MTESLNEADHELRSLLRFASGLGLNDATVFEIYAFVREEAREADVTADERLAEARRRLVQAAG